MTNLPASKTTLSNQGKLTQDSDTQLMSRRSFMCLAGIGAASALMGAQASTAQAAEASSTVQPSYVEGSFDAEGFTHFESKFVFDETYFQGSAFEYDVSRATFACALAVAAFGNAPNVNSYKDCVAYQYAQELMEKVGCTDIEVNDDFKTATGQHTIGLIAGHRPVNETDGSKATLILLGIRGSAYFREWAGNMTAGQTGQHEGFGIAADKTIAFLKDYIAAKNITGNVKVLTAGFSRAGATSNVAAGKLAVEAAKLNPQPYYGPDSGYDLGVLLGGKVTLLQKDYYSFSFEAPAGHYYHAKDTGDFHVYDSLAQTQTGYKNIHNILNPCDYVPLVMPKLWSFNRYGIDHVLPSPSAGDDYRVFRDAVLTILDNDVILQKDPEKKFHYPVDSFEYPPMDAFFNELVTKLVYDMVKTREHFYDKYQELASSVMLYIYSDAGASGIGNMTLKNFILNTLCDVLANVFRYALIPGYFVVDVVWRVIKFTYNAITGNLTKTLFETFKDALINAGLPWGKEEERIYQLLLGIADDLGDFLKQNPTLAWHAYKVFTSSNKNTNIHSGELAYASMWALDVTAGALSGSALALKANDKVLSIDDDFEYRMIQFKGDISIDYLDGDTPLRLFTDGKPVECADAPYWHGYNCDLQMCMYAPVGDYRFQIHTKEPDVEFTCTVARFGTNGTLPSKVLMLEHIGFTDDTEFIVEFERDEIMIISENTGSWAKDTSFDMDDEESDAKPLYSIDAQSANDAQGMVFGGGSNIVDTYALIVAQSADGYEFDYWTVDGDKIEEDPQYATGKNGTDKSMVVYNHRVSKDSTVVGNFKKISKPAKAGAFTAKRNGKKKAKISWGAQGKDTTGVQIRYSQAKSMKNAKYAKVKGTKANSKVIGKLTSGKRTYFQVRAYKKGVDGKFYYSAWSKVKGVKIN